jgi:hypothetical protein
MMPFELAHLPKFDNFKTSSDAFKRRGTAELRKSSSSSRIEQFIMNNNLDKNFNCDSEDAL